MSFVVAVMKPGYSVVAGDTQLNDDNGPVAAMGIKVFAVDKNTVIGFTGNYKEGRVASEQFLLQYRKEHDFAEKASLLSTLLKKYCAKGNVILIETKPRTTQYALFSNDFGWNNRMALVNHPEVRTLLPPGYDEIHNGYQFDLNNGIRSQVVNCVKMVSKHSDSVNEIVYGIEMDGERFIHFFDGIDISDIIRTKGLWTYDKEGRVVACEIL